MRNLCPGDRGHNRLPSGVRIHGEFAAGKIPRHEGMQGTRGAIFTIQQPIPELLAADRVQLNTLEHMPPFLVALWMLAATTSADQAAFWGWLYVGLRALYPFFGREATEQYSLPIVAGYISAYGILVMLVLTIQAIV